MEILEIILMWVEIDYELDIKFRDFCINRVIHSV